MLDGSHRAGLTIDRLYAARLWQLADRRIPRRLFTDEAGRHVYADALARVILPAASPSREPCQS